MKEGSVGKQTCEESFLRDLIAQRSLTPQQYPRAFGVFFDECRIAGFTALAEKIYLPRITTGDALIQKYFSELLHDNDIDIALIPGAIRAMNAYHRIERARGESLDRARALSTYEPQPVHQFSDEDFHPEKGAA